MAFCVQDTVGHHKFKTVSTPAGTSPVAGLEEDILTLTSTDGSVTITGNSGSKSVDFSAIGVRGEFHLPFFAQTTGVTIGP